MQPESPATDWMGIAGVITSLGTAIAVVWAAFSNSKQNQAVAAKVDEVKGVTDEVKSNTDGKLTEADNDLKAARSDIKRLEGMVEGLVAATKTTGTGHPVVAAGAAVQPPGPIPVEIVSTPESPVIVKPIKEE